MLYYLGVICALFPRCLRVALLDPLTFRGSGDNWVWDWCREDGAEMGLLGKLFKGQAKKKGAGLTAGCDAMGTSCPNAEQLKHKFGDF